MLDNNYAKINKVVNSHLEEELKEYGEILESVFDIEKENSNLILTSFLSLALCKQKIILRKEEVDYGSRKY